MPDWLFFALLATAGCAAFVVAFGAARAADRLVERGQRQAASISALIALGTAFAFSCAAFALLLHRFPLPDAPVCP